MLVLTRSIDESILIGSSIVVAVLGVEGRRVRIGVEAPRDVLVARDEVAERAATF